MLIQAFVYQCLRGRKPSPARVGRMNTRRPVSSVQLLPAHGGPDKGHILYSAEKAPAVEVNLLKLQLSLINCQNGFFREINTRGIPDICNHTVTKRIAIHQVIQVITSFRSQCISFNNRPKIMKP